MRLLRVDSAGIGVPRSSPKHEGKVGGEMRDSGGRVCHGGWQADAEHLGALTWEILRENRRVIIFCPTQEWTSRTAAFLAT